MPYADPGGLWLHYETWAPPGPPTGRAPILLLHGFSSCSKYWRTLTPDLLARGHTVIAADAVGHGFSDPLPERVIPVTALADHAARILDHAGAPEAVVIGHSMGGFTAQMLALSHPRRVRALVLADALSSVREMGHRRLIMPPGAMRYARFLPRRLLQWGLRRFEPWTPPECLPWLAEHFYRSDHNTLAAIARGLSQMDLTPRLPEIRVPTLIVVGEKDRITPPRGSETLHRGIPGSRLQVLPDSGHLSTLIRPAEFREALYPFLSEVPA